MKYKFDAEIKMLKGKMKWSVIYFPHPAIKHFGTNGRVNVRAIIDGHAFDSTLLPSRNGHYLVYNTLIKGKVGKALGDKVRVEIEQSETKRDVVVPEYLSAALKKNAVLKAFLEMPNYLKREEINKIETAKREETRSNRLQALIDKLTRSNHCP